MSDVREARRLTLDMPLDLSPADLRATLDSLDPDPVYDSARLLLHAAITWAVADEATANHPGSDCALTGPDDRLDLDAWSCLRCKAPAAPKAGQWWCTEGGGRRDDPSAVTAEAAIVLAVDPATVTDGQPLRVLVPGEDYYGRAEIGLTGSVTLVDRMIGVRVPIWAPQDGRNPSVIGLEEVPPDKMKWVDPRH